MRDRRGNTCHYTGKCEKMSRRTASDSPAASHACHRTCSNERVHRRREPAQQRPQPCPASASRTDSDAV